MFSRTLLRFHMRQAIILVRLRVLRVEAHVGAAPRGAFIWPPCAPDSARVRQLRAPHPTAPRETFFLLPWTIEVGGLELARLSSTTLDGSFETASATAPCYNRSTEMRLMRDR